MTPEVDVLLLTCQKLNKEKIPYMLTGSFAANFYAVPRMTRDADIVIQVHPSMLSKLFNLFNQDFYIDKNDVSDAIGHEGMFNIIHNESLFKIDFIICKNSSYRQLEFERRRQAKLGDQSIWIVTPEDLILSKLEWTKDRISTTQINDIRNLFTSVENLDLSYIDSWVQKLHLNEIYKKVRSHE